jgi:hypothetical protein
MQTHDEIPLHAHTIIHIKTPAIFYNCAILTLCRKKLFPVPPGNCCENIRRFALTVGDKILNMQSLNFKKRGEILEVGFASRTAVLPIHCAYYELNFTITKNICQGKINRDFK